MKKDLFISEDEFLDLIETALNLINDLIDGNPFIFAEEQCYNYLFDNTFTLLESTVSYFDDIDKNIDVDTRDYIDENLDLVVKFAIEISDIIIAPLRSYATSFILEKPNTKIIENHIKYLENIPQPEQRTNEWYLFRQKYLTASSAWKAFGSEKAQNELIYSKCKPLDLTKYERVNINSPMHWGQKYEPVSIQWYEATYNTKVSDFGCLPHDTINFLAASPDGINTDKTSPLYGRMLEVKNIVNREINGIPKYEYWIQMQLQMEVCGLNECDFLETRFVEYDNYEEFCKDGTFTLSKTGKQKGFIMYFEKNGYPLYEYVPLGMGEKESQQWEDSIMKKHENITWLYNIYWKMEEISCVLVMRNQYWFKFSIEPLQKIWNTIETERVTGCEHRAPTKKIKQNTIPKSKCLINIGKTFNIVTEVF